MTRTEIILYEMLHNLLKEQKIIDISVGVETRLQYLKFSKPMEYEEDKLKSP